MNWPAKDSEAAKYKSRGSLRTVELPFLLKTVHFYNPLMKEISFYFAQGAIFFLVFLLLSLHAVVPNFDTDCFSITFL